MPRYFFEILGSGAADDLLGEQLPDDRTAKKMAVAQVHELLMEGAGSGWEMSGWRMVVRDQSGRTVAVVPITPGGPEKGTEFPPSRGIDVTEKL